MRTELTKAALTRRRFDRRPEEVAAARRFVRGGLTRGSDAWETAQLLVSETVTSALDQSAPGARHAVFVLVREAQRAVPLPTSP